MTSVSCSMEQHDAEEDRNRQREDSQPIIELLSPVKKPADPRKEAHSEPAHSGAVKKVTRVVSGPSSHSLLGRKSQEDLCRELEASSQLNKELTETSKTFGQKASILSKDNKALRQLVQKLQADLARVEAVRDQPPRPMAGQYVNWDHSDAPIAVGFAWYRVSTLLRTLQEIQRGNFSITEQRQQMLDKLNGIPMEAPFAQDRRFPNDAYVSLAIGDWPRKFQQLRLALSLKDRTGNRAPIDSDSWNDTIVSFHNSITAMYTQIRLKDGVYNRVTFEDYYNLRWVGQNGEGQA